VTASLSDIGALNRRLVLEAPVETGDSAGGVTRSYEAATTLWAQVLPVSAIEDITAGSLGAVLRHHIVVRARSGITTRHRLRDGARIYRIKAVRESADRRFLEIDAEERED
jgi:SPP1 family predicted phage head-tail adaptor